MSDETVQTIEPKLYHWYVLEVKLFKGNPKHRVIALHLGRHGGQLHWKLMYTDNQAQKQQRDFEHIVVVCEIKEMQKKYSLFD